MRFKKVVSSCIQAIGYSDGKLYIKFKDGTTYRYDAPSSLYEQMKTAESVGQFFNYQVRGKFESRQIYKK